MGTIRLTPAGCNSETGLPQYHATYIVNPPYIGDFPPVPPWQPGPYVPLPPAPAITPVGWECPRCHNVMAPGFPFCVFCNGKTSTTTTTTASRDSAERLGG